MHSLAINSLTAVAAGSYQKYFTDPTLGNGRGWRTESEVFGPAGVLGGNNWLSEREPGNIHVNINEHILWRQRGDSDSDVTHGGWKMQL